MVCDKLATSFAVDASLLSPHACTTVSPCLAWKPFMVSRHSSSVGLLALEMHLEFQDTVCLDVMQKNCIPSMQNVSIDIVTSSHVVTVLWGTGVTSSLTHPGCCHAVFPSASTVLTPSVSLARTTFLCVTGQFQHLNHLQEHSQAWEHHQALKLLGTLGTLHIQLTVQFLLAFDCCDCEGVRLLL